MDPETRTLAPQTPVAARSRRRYLALLGLALAHAQPAVAEPVSGATYTIQAKANPSLWHEDGCCTRTVSTRWQPNDDFNRFVPEEQADGSFKLRVKGDGRHLRINDADEVLGTLSDADDDFARFFFELQADGYYRVRVKGNGRYLSFDPFDLLISTRNQSDDDFGRFQLNNQAGPDCVPDDEHICLNRGRFRVSAQWRTSGDTRGNGRIVPLRSDDSGLLYFFAAANWEVLVKVLDACGFNDRYWVFLAATTNVEFLIRVEDTSTGVVKTYYNPPNHTAETTTDVAAFATCP